MVLALAKRGPKVVAWLALGVGLAAIALGPVGVTLGHAKIDEALKAQGLTEAQRSSMKDELYHRASACYGVSGELGIGPLVLGAVALALGGHQDRLRA